jgi:hypothetical protein
VIASRFDLELVTVDALDANGFGRDGEPVALPETDSLIAETFQSDVGLENDTLDTADGGLCLVRGYRLGRRARPHLRGSPRARSDRLAKTNSLTSFCAPALTSWLMSLNVVSSLQTLSIANQPAGQTTDPFTRGEAPDELGGPATVAAFEGGEGHFGDVEGPPNEEGEILTRLVFVVDRRHPTGLLSRKPPMCSDWPKNWDRRWKTRCSPNMSQRFRIRWACG